ncbi:GTPase-activating protein SAC7 [Diplogelasinospora grovesii]|uniref:GTPase-activating protein SAC7 n=1 Tax=Diplogelasinospora grovesii TaxID=303347 RepID=A0AAN6N4S1_9PEZI|nr:GTPase-activating protein SAC7 [Diplogelasinospora grovesii]
MATTATDMAEFRQYMGGALRGTQGTNGDNHGSTAGPGIKRGYVHALIQYAEGDDSLFDDGIDGIDAGEEGGQFSCRISRIPFTRSAVPELVPADDDLESIAATPSTLGPTTPSLVDEVFQSFSFASSPNLDLDLASFTFTPAAAMHSGSRSAQLSDALGIINEEVEDGEKPATSQHTYMGEDDKPLPVQPNSSDRLGRRNATPPAMIARMASTSTLDTTTGHASASSRSIGSSTTSSSDDKGSFVKRSPSRKMGSLFSRLRQGRSISSRWYPEEFLERRSLTPFELSAPRPLEEDQLRPDTPPQSLAVGRSFSPLPSPAASHDMFASVKKEPVFGVDLNQSIRAAQVKIRISHKGRSTSYRTFPLSVYKCCEFIHNSGGCADAKLFSSPGDAFNVAQLKEVFSSPPDYGESFDFTATTHGGSDYTVYDVARLILLYLEELPKPLVPPSVVKSWIILARQEGAIEPQCSRIETGLDFWTDALNRLPVANRNLVKHLLNLFAQIVASLSARDSTGTGSREADARQLAGAVSRALFHSQPARDGSCSRKNNDAHPTLALAFLIVKRAEYTTSLGHLSHSRRRRDSNMFLPSTREMMEWRGHHD